MRKMDHFLEEIRLDLKQRKDLKNWMHRIACNGNTIKRAAHAFQIDEDTHLQMQELVILVEKARGLMNTLKPNGENAVEGVHIPDIESLEPVAGKVVSLPRKEEPIEDM